MWRKSRLLIWGTTYPEFSKKYYETVCTGAIDADSGRLVRIYPITLRYLDEKFGLYNWIEAEVERNEEDFRPESHHIRQDTIQIMGRLDTKDHWKERSRWVLDDRNVFGSVEELVEAEAAHHTSLGLVKPKTVKRIFVERKPDSERQEWEEQRERALQQRELFVDEEAKTNDLKYMPVKYRIEFECNHPACSGHKMSILDWGVYVLSRRQYAQRGGGPQAERDVIGKLAELTDLATKDLYLFLGNTKRFPQSFTVVGLYYPPINKQPSLPGLI